MKRTNNTGSINNESGLGVTSNNGKFMKKCKFIEDEINEVIHINGAISQTIDNNEEKIIALKLERKYLLKKLLQYEGPDNETMAIKFEKTSSNGSMSHKKTSEKPKTILNTVTSNNSKQTKLISGSLTIENNAESVSEETDFLVQPIPVDDTGHPIFPIELHGVSIYSIGEIIPNRPAYHSKDYIYPVGFCSTRNFNSLANPESKCLFTCKVLDGGIHPLFEISPEDEPRTVFSCHTVEDTFLALKTTIEKLKSGNEAIKLPGNGHDFFGFSQPIVKNLIQSMPRSRKCTKYIWTKFDVMKPKQSSKTLSSAQPTLNKLPIDKTDFNTDTVHLSENK